MQTLQPKDTTALGTILFVCAHPDDETFLGAGLMAAAVANGQTVVCITATKGDKGVQDESKWPQAELATIRAEELEKALEVLGVQHHHWLDYSDGMCHEVDEDQAIGSVMKYIDEYNVDTVVTFPPDGLTGHTDHQAVSRWATLAAAKTSRAPKVYYGVETTENYEKHMKHLDSLLNIYFMVDTPVTVPCQSCDMCFYLSPDLIEKKLHALAAMPSQTTGLIKAVPKQDWASIFAIEAYVRSDRTDITWN